MSFLQKFWHVIKEDIVGLFKECHEFGYFVRFLSFSFFVLVLKVKGTTNMKNFRPISLIESVYKLITKVVDRRMTKMMDKVESECQHVFVKRRHILDATLVANEILDDLFHKNEKDVLCRLDMEKVYGHVN